TLRNETLRMFKRSLLKSESSITDVYGYVAKLKEELNIDGSKIAAQYFKSIEAKNLRKYLSNPDIDELLKIQADDWVNDVRSENTTQVFGQSRYKGNQLKRTKLQVDPADLEDLFEDVDLPTLIQSYIRDHYANITYHDSGMYKAVDLINEDYLKLIELNSNDA